MRKQRQERIGPAPPHGRKPTAEDFTSGAVQRAVLAQTVQHPATIFPVVVAAISVLYGTLIGFNVAAYGVAFVSGMLGVGSWVFNFFIRGDTLATNHVAGLRQRRAAFEVLEVDTIVDTCSRIGCSEIAKEASELTAAYLKLRGYLDGQMQSRQSLSAQRFRVLAEDTYQEGVRTLRKALHIFQALADIDARTLEREREAWERELGRLAESQQAERRALTAKIESHKQRLALYRQRQNMLTQMVADSNEIEAALEKAYLEVVDLVDDNDESIFTKGAATQLLERAVAAARVTEEKLRGFDAVATAADDEYLAAGRQRLEQSSIRRESNV